MFNELGARLIERERQKGQRKKREREREKRENKLTPAKF